MFTRSLSLLLSLFCRFSFQDGRCSSIQSMPLNMTEARVEFELSWSLTQHSAKVKLKTKKELEEASKSVCKSERPKPMPWHNKKNETTNAIEETASNSFLCLYSYQLYIGSVSQPVSFMVQTSHPCRVLSPRSLLVFPLTDR